MQQLNLDHFAMIVECGSLTKAAERLFVSQSSLSQYLKRLEGSLGVALFDRGTTPMRLTYAGERYYAYVNQVRKMTQDIRQELIDVKEENRGRIRLGIPLWRGACMLPEFFPAFHRDYPGITLELTEGSGQYLEAALMEDTIDLAIFNILGDAVADDRLESEIIFDEPLLYAAPTMHPAVQWMLATCRYNGCFPVAPVSLVDEVPLIFTKQGQQSTRMIQNFIQKNDLHPEIVLETTNLTTAINLATEEVGAVFVPAEGAKVCKKPGRVTFFLLDTPDLLWHLAAVYRRGRYLGRLPRLLIDIVKNTLGDQKF